MAIVSFGYSCMMGLEAVNEGRACVLAQISQYDLQITED